jgi:hypothetical protein
MLVVDQLRGLYKLMVDWSSAGLWPGGVCPGCCPALVPVLLWLKAKAVLGFRHGWLCAAAANAAAAAAGASAAHPPVTVPAGVIQWSLWLMMVATGGTHG